MTSPQTLNLLTRVRIFECTTNLKSLNQNKLEMRFAINRILRQPLIQLRLYSDGKLLVKTPFLADSITQGSVGSWEKSMFACLCLQ